MVKSIIYTLTAVALCLTFFIWTDFYIGRQFDEMHTALSSLYDKTEDGVATREDAVAVKELWENKKKKLHVFIPHNDISCVDRYLSETCALLYTGQYDFASGKIEVLVELMKAVPGGYKLKFENVF